MDADQYPVIAGLRKALVDHALDLSLGTDDDHLRSRSYRRINLKLPRSGGGLSIPVDDEYDDAADAHPAMLLHLVLAECENYETADNFLVWAKESGLDPAEAWVRALYGELGEVVPTIRGILGPDVEPVSSFDFGLNAGAARALRDLTE